MRSYMPGAHRRFLEDVGKIANIRPFVEARRHDRALCIAYDACLAMLRVFRDKHIQMVTRYIIIKARETRSHSRSTSSNSAPKAVNIASASSQKFDHKDGKEAAVPAARNLRGTGGTALIPFLKQARDETGEPAVDQWVRRILGRGRGAKDSPFAELGKVGKDTEGELEIVGLAGTWAVDESSEGGLCHW
jgi:indoleamine 2,3-dioxygenase